MAEIKSAESLQDVMDGLAAMKVSLWPGVVYDLTDPKDLRAAAEWLVEEAGRVGLLPPDPRKELTH